VKQHETTNKITHIHKDAHIRNTKNTHSDTHTDTRTHSYNSQYSRQTIPDVNASMEVSTRIVARANHTTTTNRLQHSVLRAAALPAAQPTVSKHMRRQQNNHFDSTTTQHIQLLMNTEYVGGV